MTEKTLEIRCSAKRSTKSAGDVICRRFLAKMDRHSFTIVCPRCKHVYIITAAPMRGLNVQRVAKETRLLSEPEECADGHNPE